TGRVESLAMGHGYGQPPNVRTGAPVALWAFPRPAVATPRPLRPDGPGTFGGPLRNGRALRRGSGRLVRPEPPRVVRRAYRRGPGARGDPGGRPCRAGPANPGPRPCFRTPLLPGQ